MLACCADVLLVSLPSDAFLPPLSLSLTLPLLSLSLCPPPCWVPLLHCEIYTVHCHNEKLTFSLIKSESHLEERSLIVDAGQIKESLVFRLNLTAVSDNLRDGVQALISRPCKSLVRLLGCLW